MEHNRTLVENIASYKAPKYGSNRGFPEVFIWGFLEVQLPGPLSLDLEKTSRPKPRQTSVFFPRFSLNWIKSFVHIERSTLNFWTFFQKERKHRSIRKNSFVKKRKFVGICCLLRSFSRQTSTAKSQRENANIITRKLCNEALRRMWPSFRIVSSGISFTVHHPVWR